MNEEGNPVYVIQRFYNFSKPKEKQNSAIPYAYS